MTDEAMRIAIAESCGWKQDFLHHGPLVWHRNGVYAKTNDELPNYPHDLNAMREAEQLLDGDGWRIYLGFLGGRRTIPKLMSMDEFHRCWNSDAPQRAPAFLKTVGKWKD